MITTLIFDWGGVLTIGRYTRSILNVLAKEKPISIEAIYPDFDQFIVQMDKGAISFNEFIDLVNAKFNLGITKKEMEEVFKKAIVPNKEVIELLEHLRS